MPTFISNLLPFLHKHLIPLIIVIVLLAGLGGFWAFKSTQDSPDINLGNSFLNSNNSVLKEQLASVSAELETLKNQDQVKFNLELNSEIKNIQDTYKSALTTYENLLDYKVGGKRADDLDKLFATALKLLSERNYASAAAKLSELDTKIKQEQEKAAAALKIVTAEKQTVTQEQAPVNNTPPSSGYSRQKVQNDLGSFTVDIISADLNSTRVIVDSASDSDCRDNCPVLSLADYVSRSGAYAGINGSYFCPASYPTCAGKTNSFDTLLMNKNKKYINSDNNVFSTVPAVIFSGSSARFVSQSLEWGRDTGVDAVLANHPLLLLNGQVMFGGNSDPKQGSKGPRSFVGATGNTAYIGVVQNATVAEGARVLQTMGISSALNLDSGGSTALYSGGYKAGPGRNIPNALLFVRK